MKKRLLAGLLAGVFVLSGCSGLSEDNSLNARTHRYLDQHSEEMKRLSEEQKRMSDMIAAVTIEPAKQYPSKFERQIVAEFYNSIMNECGFGNKFGCNLDEIVKDPYKGRKAYIQWSGSPTDYTRLYKKFIILSDYIPSKQIKIQEVYSDLAPLYHGLWWKGQDVFFNNLKKKLNSGYEVWEGELHRLNVKGRKIELVPIGTYAYYGYASDITILKKDKQQYYDKAIEEMKFDYWDGYNF